MIARVHFEIKNGIIIKSVFVFISGITIGFVPNEVSVPESAGTVQLCAQVISGNPNLERDVVIAFNTVDGDSGAGGNAATGECTYVCV